PDAGQHKTYGALDPTLTFTNDAGLLGTDFSGALSRDPGETVAGGPYNITLGSLSAGSNYSLSLPAAPVTLAIVAKGVVVTPDAGQHKTYGALDPTLTFTNDAGLLGTDFSGALSRDPGETVAGGPYNITLGSLSAGSNYSLSLPAAPVTFAIVAKGVVVTPDAGQHKTYGALDPTLTFTNDAGLLGTDFSGALSRDPGETVAGGPYNITLGSLSAGSNYSLSLPAAPVTFAIVAKGVVVTPDAGQHKTYGALDPTLT